MPKKKLFFWSLGLSLLLLLTFTVIPQSQAVADDDTWLPLPLTGGLFTGSPFGGYNASGGQAFHNAIDIGRYDGAEILAVADGTVVYTDWWPKRTEDVNRYNGGQRIGHGWIVAILHNNGTYTYSAHLKEGYIVEPGQFVQKGDVVGYMGQSGFAIYGSHIHFSVAKYDPVTMEQLDCWDTSCWYNPHDFLGIAPNLGTQIPETPLTAKYVFDGPTVPDGYTIEGGLVFIEPQTNPVDEINIYLVRNKVAVQIALLVLIVVFVLRFVSSKDFRTTSYAAVTVGLLIVIGIVWVGQVKASPAIFKAHRENLVFVVGGVGETDAETVSFVLSKSEDATETILSDQTPPDNTNCSLPSSYPADVLRWCAWIEEYAVQNGLEPRLIAAVITQESGGNPNAYSKDGAVGLMQIMPSDGLSYLKYGSLFANRATEAQYFVPKFCIKSGTKILADNITYYGSIRDGLRHYGPTCGYIPDPQDSEKYILDPDCDPYFYADIVLAIYERFQ